ncbi:MAG TPA: hypothetical protein VFZ61_19995, partial [Polyangiales bacterium]
LGVAARRTGKHLERALAVSDVPGNMVARAIALALTELLRSSWYELSVPPNLDVSPVAPAAPTLRLHADVLVASADRNDAARAIRQRLRLEWRAGGRVYPQTDSGEASSAFGLSKLLGLRTRLAVALSAAGGGGANSDARVFQTTTRTTVSLCGQGDSPMLEVGGSIEFGYARLNGIYAGLADGFISTALVHGTLRVQAAQEIEVLIALQAGYVLAPVTLRGPVDADGPLGPTIGFKGPMIGLEVGVAGLL